MGSSQAKTPEEYIAELSPDRRAAISRVRDVVRRNLPEGYEEGMLSGHRLDRGKSCVHFRRAEDLPLDLIGEVIARTPLETYVARYQPLRGA